MRIIADFHIHSKYSRATSPDMNVRTLAKYGDMKGINLLGTGDFTHPEYFRELRENLEPLGNGFFKVKDTKSKLQFILTVEISTIFSVKGKVKRAHTIVFAPSLEVAEKINQALGKRGKLASDGRPILGMHVKELVKIVLDVSPDCLLVPAHAWTPWFSVFGSNSGFDSLEECFEEQTKNIYAIETGLSSDPAMNWRLSELDNITLISNSDSHSPSRIGREANVFDCKMDYYEIMDVLKKGDPKRFLSTIEFFPAEGKYHWDGHRACGVALEPSLSKKQNNLCPKCGKKMTLGVLHRVEELADRKEGYKPKGRIPFKNMIPLDEIIGDCLGKGVASKAVKIEYQQMIDRLGPELGILFDRSIEELKSAASAKVVEGISRVREGKVEITPGYDGEYGKIKLFE